MRNGGEDLPAVTLVSEGLAARLEQILIGAGYSPRFENAHFASQVTEMLRTNPRIFFASGGGNAEDISAVLRAVREHDRALPVIMVVDAEQEGAAIEAMRSGARDYVLNDHLNRLPVVVERELRESDWRREHARFEARLQQTQRLESIGLLAGGVAHDFNNLLTGILGNSSMALDAVPRSSPARKMLSDIIDATHRAANLTRQLLAYAGKGSIVSEPLDVSDLVDEISVLLQCSIPPNVQLRNDLKRRLPCVMGDATQLQQLVMNLVMNGAEAIGDANGTVLITTGLQDVDELYIQQNLQGDPIIPGRYVILEVHDSGSGIDAATRSRIFEPFFTTKMTGRGLGLAAAHGIVQAHKGAIRVYSAPGQGSTFKVLLPASDEEAIPRHSSAKSREAAGRERVLIVDDEEIVRQTAKAALLRYGYRPELAPGGEEALDIYARTSGDIALVLLDLTMPGLSGEETAKRLLALNPDCNILLSSGYNEAEALRLAAHVKICGFIQKPYTAATLAEKVHECLHAAPPASSTAIFPEAREGER